MYCVFAHNPQSHTSHCEARRQSRAREDTMMHNHADWCTTTLMEKNITRLGCTEYTMVHIGERNGAKEEEGNCNCKETMETHCTSHIVHCCTLLQNKITQQHWSGAPSAHWWAPHLVEEEDGNCNCKETMPSLPRLLALEGQKLSRDNVLHSDCTSLTYNLRTTLKFFLLKAELTH